MKVIAINGSPKNDGNTATVLRVMAEELEKEGIETEIIQVGHALIHGCIGCGGCFKDPENKCVFKDDLVNEVTAKMREADGLILGSPTYFGGIAGAMKAFLDRAFYSSYSGYFRNKVATAAAVVRRAGGVEVFNQLLNYLNLAETVTPPSQYWGVVYGAAPQEALKDEEGLQVVRRNAGAMAWLLKNAEAGKQAGVALPGTEKKSRTNFIR